MNRYKEITIYPFSSSAQGGRSLLCFHGQYYEANGPVVELLEELQQHATEEAAISAYIQKKECKYTMEQVRQVIDKFFAPMFKDKMRAHSFLYERQLLGASSVDAFSDRFRFLFNPVYMCIILGVALALDIWFFFTTPDFLLFNNTVDLYMVVALLVFLLASSFFHELGHASACKYFGVRHGGIGFGLYLNFPVLYTDVTEVWKLNRTQRCVVNLAGVYFQCYWLIILLVVFFLSGNDMVRYLILVMNLGFGMTLNPFFRFDGYWMASDLLGVPNLRQRSWEVVEYTWRRLCRRPTGKKPCLLQIRTAEKYGMLFYSVVVNFFMGFYFLYVIPLFLYRFVYTFPDEMNELILYLSNRMAPPFVLLRNLSAQLVFMTLIGYLIYRLLAPFVRRKIHSGE